MLLEDEESVSIHPQKELLRPDAESCSVGTTCVVPFGKHQYEGKIISSGSSCKTFLLIAVNSNLLPREIQYVYNYREQVGDDNGRKGLHTRIARTGCRLVSKNCPALL